MHILLSVPSLNYVMIAMLVFEIIITIGQEVTCITSRKFTLPAWIYVVNRYAALLYFLSLHIPSPTKKVSGLITKVVSFAKPSF